MKKLFLVFGLLSLMLIPNTTKAATFNNAGVNYALVQKTLSCSLSEDAYLIGKTENYYVLHDEIEENINKLYKLDFSNTCTEFTKQEYYDFFSELPYRYRIVDNKIVKKVDVFNAFFETNDNNISSGKTYYFPQGNGFSIVSNPDVSQIGRYYEAANFMLYPKFAIINENLTYYRYEFLTGSGPIVDKAEVNELANLDSYYIKYDGNDESEIVATINDAKFNTLEDLEIIKVNGADEYFLADTSDNLYDLNGNLIKNLEHARDISKIMDNLLLINYSNKSSKILNSDYEQIYNFEGESDTVHSKLSSDDNLDYIISYNNGALAKTYELRRYKEENITNHNFNNNDLIFTFSGEYLKLNSVKVNGIELDSKYYTKANGSTIITLKKEYLKTLSKGTYTLKVSYTDGGNASTTFGIPEENPQTNDRIINSILLGCLSLLATVGSVIYLNKKKRFN